MTQAIIAHGALVERSQNGTAFTAIPETKGVAIPSIAPEYLDASHTQSPDAFREYVKGMKDLGELSIPANYTTAGFTQQLADQDFNGPISYRVTLRAAPGQTSGDRFEFQGYPTPQVEQPTDPNEIIMMNVMIRTTGNFTFTAGTTGGGA